ncbi:MAG: hypothetical protein AAGF11_01310 [Myxococcota bacterium]
MSMSYSYVCERPSRRRVNVRISGLFTEENMPSLREELEAIGREEEGKPFDVLFDFTTAEQCEVRTRHALLELQRMLKHFPGRTAYVADRPQVWGIALWVIHQADDGRARAMVRVAHAERWFAQDDDQITTCPGPAR